MTALLWFVLVALTAYLLRRWHKRHAIEVRPAAPAGPERSMSTRPEQSRQTKQASAAISHADGIEAVESYCLAVTDGTGPKARAVLAQVLGRHLADGGALARQLDIAFESLAIIENTKNTETLLSRLSVARQALNQACAEAEHVFTPVHCSRLVAICDEAASGRLADLAVAKVEDLKAKAGAAKTEGTRNKHLAAARAYAEEAARHPNIQRADGARILACVP